MGAWTEGLLGRLGFALVGLAALAVPLALVWAGLGLWLGLNQRRIARYRDLAGAAAPAVTSTAS
jgi:ATP:ADP antiporter, AAA family